MNIAIPVSNHDKHLLPTFVKVLQHFGGLEEATLCFFTTPSAKAETHEAANALNANVHTFEVDFAGGWPVASGAQFAATVFTIPSIGWNGPWLWMELDMLPVKHGWIQAIRNGYTLCGSPFMGNVVPTAWVEEGKLVVKEDDLMMMGCGVYPANMHADQRYLPLVTDLLKPSFAVNEPSPFDFHLRHAMSQAGIANTTLIADMWQTCEYKKTAKGITCKPVPLDKPRRERGGLVPPEAVLVHGCKDGTLAELLLAGGATKSALDVAFEKFAVRESEAALRNSPMAKLLHANIAVTDSLSPGVGAVVMGQGSPPIVLTEAESTDLTEALEAPPAPPTPAIVEAVQLHREAVTESPEPEKPKITRTAVEALRKSKKGVAFDIAQGLGITLGEFAGMLPKLGYVIAKGGKLKSTEP